MNIAAIRDLQRHLGSAKVSSGTVSRSLNSLMTCEPERV
jgi:hypothetical protein